MSEPFPYRLERAGVVMSPEPGHPLEAEGVLNPGSGLAVDGTVYLLPRLVAAGNVSRVGLARVVTEHAVPVGVERLGVVLEPEEAYERAVDHAGTEDPRVTWIPALRTFVMTYVAFGPEGARTAVAISQGLRRWRRLGPVRYSGVAPGDAPKPLDRVDNKDTVFFPRPVRSPAGVPSLAVLHRPMWAEPERQSIWIAFVPLAAVWHDLAALTHWTENRFLAGPEFAFEEWKIGAGPPPVRVPEGWLVLHHGVRRTATGASYAAGGMILDADEPWRVLARTSEPLLSAETEDERSGTVSNVVFPTAVESFGGQPYVFYGMADSKIGAARLLRRPASD